MADHALQADPGHYTLETENDRVRVIRGRYGPGEKSSMHSHPDLVVIAMTDAEVRFGFPDGTSQDIHMDRGQAMAMESVTHLPENIGNQPMEVLLVELK